MERSLIPQKRLRESVRESEHEVDAGKPPKQISRTSAEDDSEEEIEQEQTHPIHDTDTLEGPPIEILDPQLQLLNHINASTIQLVNYLQKYDCEHEITAQSPLISFEDLSFVKSQAINALCAIPNETKTKLVTGRLLAEEHELPPVVRKIYEMKLGRPSSKNPQPYTNVPIVYGIFHVGKTGLPPTGTQYASILDVCRKYYKRKGGKTYDESSQERQEEYDNLAKTIDCKMSVGRQAWLDSEMYKEGGRRYVEDKAAVRNLSAWRKLVSRRINEMPDQNAPLPWCPALFGYTYNAANRRQNHQRHISSNTLMNLIDAICKSFFEEDGLQMKFKVLYEIFDRDQAGPMEHILSHLTMSYIHLGGFNGRCAGKSNGSARNVPIWVYDQLEQEALERPCYQKQFQAEKEYWESIKTNHTVHILRHEKYTLASTCDTAIAACIFIRPDYLIYSKVFYDLRIKALRSSGSIKCNTTHPHPLANFIC